MLTERQSRIRFLARTNHVLRESPAFLSGLSDVLGREVGVESLLPIDQSDYVRALFWEGYGQALEAPEKCFRMIQTEAGLEELATNIERFQGASKDEAVILFPTSLESGLCLALREILRSIWRVLQFDRNTVALSSSDGICGLLLDWDVAHPNDAFELTIWGSRWVEAIV